MKLGVIVPYRGRPTHLRKFKDHLTTYLKSKNISFQIIVVEQTDTLPFNRGKLLNIGFLEALKNDVIMLFFTMWICYHCV